jgi:hypothetical protein
MDNFSHFRQIQSGTFGFISKIENPNHHLNLRWPVDGDITSASGTEDPGWNPARVSGL